MDMYSNNPLERTLAAPESDIFGINDRAAEYARLMDATEEIMKVDSVRVREDSGASVLPYVLEYRGCISPGFLCWRSGGEARNGNSLAIPLGDLPGNAVRSLVSVIYDEYQKVKARKRRLSNTPPPRLVRAALSAGSLSSISSTSAEILPNRDLLADAYRRFTSEALLLRGQVGVDEGVAGEARRSLESRGKEYRRHLFLSEGFNRQSENLSQAATPRSVIGS
ncbi:hypothetical protein F2Q68_00039250 [Brassica cretica]|uniref:Uncharacterized protein n=1 Tax=Brassica cretica TaxID=69181 RepID=A0A8S9MR60_BRACR|nr:hypothetical protein F2Q68_00039250 [Brassica cretica]